jgi:hypothetical protein
MLERLQRLGNAVLMNSGGSPCAGSSSRSKAPAAAPEAYSFESSGDSFVAPTYPNAPMAQHFEAPAVMMPMLPMQPAMPGPLLSGANQFMPTMPYEPHDPVAYSSFPVMNYPAPTCNFAAAVGTPLQQGTFAAAMPAGDCFVPASGTHQGFPATTGDYFVQPELQMQGFPSMDHPSHMPVEFNPYSELVPEYLTAPCSHMSREVGYARQTTPTMYED